MLTSLPTLQLQRRQTKELCNLSAVLVMAEDCRVSTWAQCTRSPGAWVCYCGCTPSARPAELELARWTQRAA